MDTYRNYITGQWVESVSQNRAENTNPANTEDVIGVVRLATREEARRAVEAAAENLPAWRSTPAEAFSRCLDRDPESTRLNSRHLVISYAGFLFEKKTAPLRPIHSSTP